MEDILVPIVVVGILFLGLPWVIFHYITKWKTSATLTNEDEAMLDQMHETARRLDDPCGQFVGIPEGLRQGPTTLHRAQSAARGGRQGRPAYRVGGWRHKPCGRR